MRRNGATRTRTHRTGAAHRLSAPWWNRGRIRSDSLEARFPGPTISSTLILGAFYTPRRPLTPPCDWRSNREQNTATRNIFQDGISTGGRLERPPRLDASGARLSPKLIEPI